MLEETLVSVVSKLAAAQRKGLCKRYALIGGLAVSARGFVRATQDVDFLVEVEDAKCLDLARALDADFIEPDLDDPIAGAFRFRSSEQVLVPVQAIRLSRDITNVALGDVTEVSIVTVNVPVVGLNGLIILKLYAGGEIDLLDIRQLFEANEVGAQAKKELLALAARFKLDELLETLLGQL